MSVPALEIHAHLTPPEIEITRGDGIPDAFWLQVRAEWGSDGRRPAQIIVVPLERFLSNLGWLAPACRRYNVDIKWDNTTVAYIGTLNHEKSVLSELLRQDKRQLEQLDTSIDLPGFRRQLFPFQIRDALRLMSLPHGANFSVPGAGKTTVTFAVFQAERIRGRVKKLLVVSPLSAYSSWIEEATKCFDPLLTIQPFDGGVIEKKTDVLLVNYQRLTANYDALAMWVAHSPTHIVLDEAHRMKRGWEGQWGSACLNLAYLATRRDILTGTPAPQGIYDLRALFGFIWPNQMSKVIPSSTSVNNNPILANEIANRIRPLFVRTTKRELKLPPPQYRALYIPLSGLHAEIYKALLNQYLGQFALSKQDRVSFAQMGEVIMYLLEAATNPALLVAGSSPYDPIVFKHPPIPIPQDSPLRALLTDYSLYETPPKFVELAKLVESNVVQGRKTLIWSNFVRNLQTLERMFGRYDPAMVHGGVPSVVSEPSAIRTREQELERFRSSETCMVLLANPAATAEGISLHEICHDAVYLDRTFNAGQYLQSVDRIHRLGLQRDEETRITFLIASDTIDMHVDRRVREKTEALSQLLEDPDIVTMALPNEDDYGNVLDSSEDITALFAHLRGKDRD